MAENGMALEIDIQERIIQFAARIIKFCETLPNTMAGNQIAGELLRSGLTPAAHYSGAINSLDASEFINRLRMAIKDLNESAVWLRIIIAGDLLPDNKVDPLLDECQQLQRIIKAGIKTARETAS